MKKFCELSIEEMKTVFDHNEKLRNEVLNDMFENANNWCCEYLDSWERGIDYSIGYDRGTYFKCTDKEYFLSGLQKAQSAYCFLEDSYNKTIEYTISLLKNWIRFIILHPKKIVPCWKIALTN